jgi:hypothetical protein
MSYISQTIEYPAMSEFEIDRRVEKAIEKADKDFLDRKLDGDQYVERLARIHVWCRAMHDRRKISRC